MVHKTLPTWTFNVRTIGNTKPTVYEICKALHGFVDECSAIRHAAALKFDGTATIRGRGPQEDINAIAHCLEVIGLGVVVTAQENAA